MKKAILCVDDEKIILLSLVEQLIESFGEKYIYETAMSAEEALMIIDDLVGQEVSLILIISDWLMQGMKGDELLVEVNEMYPGTLNIMLTGQATSEAIENAVENAGLNAYVKKPWNKDELMAKVGELLGEV